MEYNIKKHIHLYASWAASRAAMTSKLNRFKVNVGQNILNSSDIKEFILSPEKLPSNTENFDKSHKVWREQVIELSTKHANKTFTHGVAAKLINVYLKGIIICGGHHDHDNSKYIHPPIDSILLTELANQNFNNNKRFWIEAKKVAWSNYDSYYYQRVINEIRSGLNENPLWTIEKYWRGYQ